MYLSPEKVLAISSLSLFPSLVRFPRYNKCKKKIRVGVNTRFTAQSATGNECRLRVRVVPIINVHAFTKRCRKVNIYKIKNVILFKQFQFSFCNSLDGF